MKIVSWNVNGLRAVHRKGALECVFAIDPDILLLQETKSSPEQLPDDVRKIAGYKAYFNSSQEKKGYSGVALYSKIEPKKVEYSIGVPELDTEGRYIEAHYDDIIVINCYFPNGGQGPHRLSYKMSYYDAFLKRINQVEKKQPNVLFGGDVNTAHEAIDLARPKNNENSTGFLPEERFWLDEVVSAGYSDVFRHFHPETTDAYTYWDTQTRARERNVGWRIDYFFASKALLPKLQKTAIHSDVLGSDHCPISVVVL